MIDFNKDSNELSIGKIGLITSLFIILVTFIFLCIDFPPANNDGVTLWCSFQVGVFDLLHPGNLKIIPCSFDHQPLYFILMKPFQLIVERTKHVNPLLLRIPNILCFITASILFLSLHIKKSKNLLFSSLIFLLVFLNIPNLLDFISIRMYALYFLFTILQIFYFEKIDNKDKNFTLFTLVNIIAGLNFYASHFAALPLYLSLFMQGKVNIKNHWRIITIYILSIIYKLPSIIYFRVFDRRNGDLSSSLGLDLNYYFKYFSSLINDQPILLFCFILIIIDSFFNKSHIKSKIISLYSFTFILFIFVMKFVLKMDEVETRYFSFIAIHISLFYIKKRESNLAKKSYLILFLISAFFATLHIFTNLSEYKINLFAARNTINESNLLKLKAKYHDHSNKLCVDPSSYTMYFFYMQAYIYAEGKLDIPRCEDQASSKYILSTQPNPFKNYSTDEYKVAHKEKIVGNFPPFQYISILKKLSIPK